jgi:hypothetical protein
MSAAAQLTTQLSAFDRVLWRSKDALSLSEATEKAFRAARSRGEVTDQLTVWTVLTAADSDAADRIVTSAVGRVSQRKQLGNVSLVLVADETEPFVLSVWPAREGVAHLVSTVPASDGRWKRVERWVANSSPHIAPCYLSESDLLSIGEALAEYGDVAVSKITARREDGASLSEGFPRTKPTLGQAVAQLDRRAQVRTALLHVDDVLSIHIRRLAGATFYSGDFRVFAECVLSRLEQAAETHRQLFEGRHRVPKKQPPEPVRISLAGAFFNDAYETGELLDSLNELPHLAVAVVHRNPYFHAAVSDHLDGSSFDVFVTAEDEIVVHPGFRASLGSFARLIQHISEAFPATDVSTKPLARVSSLEELAAAGG